MSTYTLYGGDVELCFDRQKHVYTVDDEVVPNVTQITSVIAKHGLDGWKFRQALEHLEGRLRPGLDEVALRRLLDDAANAADKVTREAGFIGSSIHKWVEEYIAGTRSETPEHPAVRAAVEAFLAWEDEAKPEWLASERKVMSREHRYVGTLDALARLDGKLCVVDFKSSNRVYVEHFAQIGAYALAVEEEDARRVDGGVVLQLPKAPGKKAKAYPCEDLEADKELFLGIRKIYRRVFKK